ncbi:MAG: serine protease inhibitor [Oscillospiraceae bacterium]|nr:serine protease inhibitor [Oscillospiraceae bacterium]
MKLKKLISVLSAITMLAGSANCIVSAAAKGAGDVDQNGKVEIADAIMLARWLAEDDITVTTAGLSDADLTGDGIVTADDQAKLLCWLAGVEQNDPQPQERRSVDLLSGIEQGEVTKLAPAAAEFTAAQAKFSADLLREIQDAEEDKDKNLLLSPVSVSLALGMTMNGAKGQTLEEMQKVLGDDLTAEKLNQYYAGWSYQLLQPNLISFWDYDENGNIKRFDAESTPITIANAIWFRDNEQMIHVPQSFLQTTADYYKAGAFKAPFNQSTVDDINGWCFENTHHMIPNVIDYLPEDAVMVLANALTFEDNWAEVYEEYQVRDETFHASNGKNHDVEMMSATENVYLHDDKATGFIKSYRDPRYSFAAVLPNEDVSLDEYIASLDGEKLWNLTESKEHCEVITKMPKFQFDYELNMNDTLKALGMPTAFMPGIADFTGLNDLEDMPTWIGKVIHKTHIDLSETGTKAAAVTAVIMEAGCALDPDKPEPKEVILDRPFLFMIMDNTTGLPIFIGTVKDIQPAE